ncbi:MAG: hypothetical protein RL710_400 [Pseudomonadota bacterium]|jgi:hypothetical protein
MTTTIQKDALLSQFAALAYKDDVFLRDRTNLPSGWKVVDSEVKGPFAAFAFKNDATGEVVLAYRGTDGLKDGIADKAILTGSWDTQFQQGLDFAQKVRKNTDIFGEGTNPNSLLVTGHSLGGALAQVVAYAFGLDGSTIDPGAAARIVQTQEFRNAAQALNLNPDNLTMPTTFTNHVVAGSLVSNGSGPHLGQESYLPSLKFSGQQALYTFVIGLLSPAAGFAYAMGVDQFGNRHSSTQVSQALGLLAGKMGSGLAFKQTLVYEAQQVTRVL